MSAFCLLIFPTISYHVLFEEIKIILLPKEGRQSYVIWLPKIPGKARPQISLLWTMFNKFTLSEIHENDMINAAIASTRPKKYQKSFNANLNYYCHSIALPHIQLSLKSNLLVLWTLAKGIKNIRGLFTNNYWCSDCTGVSTSKSFMAHETEDC